MSILSEEFRAWEGFLRSEFKEIFTFPKHFLSRVLKHFSCLPLLILQTFLFLLILSCISVCLLLVVQILSQVYLFKKEEKKVIFFSNSKFMGLFLFQAANLCCLRNFFVLSFPLHYGKSSPLPVKDLLLYFSICLNNVVTSCSLLPPQYYKSSAALRHYKAVLLKSHFSCPSHLPAPPNSLLVFCSRSSLLASKWALTTYFS